MRIGILNDFQGMALQSADWSIVGRDAEIAVFDHALRVPGDEAALAGFEVLCAMRERMPFTREAFECLPDLRLLVTTGEFNAAVDLEAATANGVLVCGTRNSFSRRVTAELTWAVILMAARGLPAETASVRRGGWQVGLGRMLHGRTLGLLGVGHIGAMVAGYGRAFGMQVLAHSPNLTAERANALSLNSVSKAELFARSDVVSVHLVLSERSRGAVGAAEIKMMKSAAVLVNTSRGPLVDEAALLSALDEARISCAALDVFDVEPLPADHPFRRHPRVLATPHIGYVSAEVYRDFFADTVEAIAAYKAGRPVRVLNPPLLEAGGISS